MNSKAEKEDIRKIVGSVLSERTVKSLWTANYSQVIPMTPQDFSLEGILPAVFYMFRWGHRRGKGKFYDNFKAINSKKGPSIEDIAKNLAQSPSSIVGFLGHVEQAILGDLLLCLCLENKQHKTGRTEGVQRVYPTHYMTSWIDVPTRVSNFRYVPEMLVSILAKQSDGKDIENKKKHSRFAVIEKGFSDNLLLELFSKGMSIEGELSNIRSDRFDEESLVGIDQLLSIRIAQLCGEAPQKIKGQGEEREKISNQRPIATQATDIFFNDFNIFLQAYGQTIPRQSLLPMLESGLALGITNIYLSTASNLLEWENSGKVPEQNEQQPWSLFVDCSTGNDYELRRLSEESMEDCIRRFERIPVIMMCLRLLDLAVRSEPDLKKEKLPDEQPDATEWLNLLGSIMYKSHQCSSQILRDTARSCYQLAEALEEKDESPTACDILRVEDINPIMRLAEVLILLMGDSIQSRQFISALDSSLMIDKPNGLAKKRKRTTTNKGNRKQSDARSIILTNTMLDFLVHRYLKKAAKGKGDKALSFVEFIEILRKRYGLYVDQSPPGMSIPAELLLRNRRFLERRLRDLGLLMGVNDAESMKRLQPRFKLEDNYKC